jgi:hypothetical protein
MRHYSFPFWAWPNFSPPFKSIKNSSIETDYIALFITDFNTSLVYFLRALNIPARLMHCKSLKRGGNLEE